MPGNQRPEPSPSGQAHLEAQHPINGRRVYFARAIDGRDPQFERHQAFTVGGELTAAGLTIVDPLIGEPQSAPRDTADDNLVRYRALVEHDLSILRTCDAVLMDMSLPNRNYIGCVCEMTYAYIWKIPCIVYVGTNEIERPWLHYHAAAVVRARVDAIATLASLVAARGPSSDEGQDGLEPLVPEQ
jgi:hypothetical protein